MVNYSGGGVTTVITPSGDTTGTTDSAVIAAKLTAGSNVTLANGYGAFYIKSPVTVPPNAVFQGAVRTYWWATEAGYSALQPNCRIVLASGFSGAAAIQVVDQATGGYSSGSGNQTIRNITVDGGFGTGGTVDGFRSFGSVFGVTLENCFMQGMGSHGYDIVFNGSASGYGFLDQLDMRGCVARSCAGDGFHLRGLDDSTVTGCHAISNNNGWVVIDPLNTKFIGCKGENSVLEGWQFQLTNVAAGRVTMTACSTNLNGTNGLDVTGNGAGAVLQVSNCDFCGDGFATSGGGGTAAGVLVNACQATVMLSNVRVVSGVATDATSYQPFYGLKMATYRRVNIAGSIFQANAAGTGILDDFSGSVTADTGVFTYNGTTDKNPTGLAYVGVSTNAQLSVFNSIDVGAVGKGLRVAEGANAKQGVAVLVAGASVVANTAVTATSRILLTSNADGGTPGWVRVSARTAGTSFTITSSSGTDTSTVAYQIFEPG